ncbi:MAG: activator of HSP90 ATPase [Actinobacteria bacterium]|nr:MAG: activator of HSP90 ATPase [Actinomycetota bacterium]
MIQDRIEREILIEAPPEVVWRTITEPDQIVSWFSEAAELDPRPGGAGELTWEPGGKATVDPEEPVTAALRVEKLEPPHYFSFRWMHPAGAEPDPNNSVLVEFSLNPEGEKTRLRLVESGFRNLPGPEDETERTVDGHSAGWDNHLGRLRAYLSSKLTEPAPE